MNALPALAMAEKELGSFPGWSDEEAETGYSWFDAPLEVGGVTERGFVLHGGCQLNQPDRHVTFEVRISRSQGRRSLPLMRVDWRSLHGTHSNPRRGASAWSGRTVSSTHFHDFELNWLPVEGRMREGNLKLAREIEEELPTFDTLRAYVGRVFRITNMHIVTPPPWEFRLEL